jgi:hypothetical protein
MELLGVARANWLLFFFPSSTVLVEWANRKPRLRTNWGRVTRKTGKAVNRATIMEQTEPPNSSPGAGTSQSSLGARLVNVFVAPGEVFDEVKSSPPNNANWISPLVLAIIVGIVYSMVIFGQPAIIQNSREALDKGLQQKVADGKMTKQQADQASAMMDRIMTPTYYRVIGILSSMIVMPIYLFFIAFVMWLVGRYGLGARFGYMQTVEVASLSLMIVVLDSIVRMLLGVIYSNVLATPGPVLLIMGHFDQASRTHILLSALDVIYLWFVGVRAAGLAKLSGKSFIAAGAWLYGIWALWNLALIFLVPGRHW